MSRHDLEPFERQRRLIALKRYERPAAGYAEDFLADFKERQRREILERSSRSLFWERLKTRFPELFRPRAVGAALGMPAAALLTFGVWFYLRPAPPRSFVIEPVDRPIVLPVSIPQSQFEKPESVGDSSRLDSIRLIVAEPPRFEDDI